MNQKQIIQYLSKWFNLTEILELEEFGGEEITISTSTQSTIDELTACINLVIDEIACDYFPLLTTQVVTAKDYQIPYSDLDKQILRVFAVKKYNSSIPYKSFPNHIKVDVNGEILLTYSYIPTTPKTIYDNLEVVGSPLTPRIVAYGVAREYCIFNSLYDQAEHYNARFTSAMENAMTKRSAIKLPKRRWM